MASWSGRIPKVAGEAVARAKATAGVTGKWSRGCREVEEGGREAASSVGGKDVATQTKQQSDVDVDGVTWPSEGDTRDSRARGDCTAARKETI